MPQTLRRSIRPCLVLAVALAAVLTAGVASAQVLLCLDLDDGLLGSPPLIYRLNTTLPGNNTASFVGTAHQGGARRVATGGGAFINPHFEITLQATDAVSSGQSSGTPLLVMTNTHITLNGPAFTNGTFESVQIRVPEPGQASGVPTVVTADGTVTVIACPPLN